MKFLIKFLVTPKVAENKLLISLVYEGNLPILHFKF